MKVIIEEQVHQSILEFYAVSMRLHPSLDEETVMAKVERLTGAMNDLGKHPFIYADALYNYHSFSESTVNLKKNK